MLPRGQRNTGTHLLDMPMRTSLLAKARLPLDVRTLGAWTASMLHGTRSQQTRTKIILGSPGTADETPPRRRGCIYRSMETHLAHTKQRLHHQLVDATQPRDVPTSGLDHGWQRAGILGD